MKKTNIECPSLAAEAAKAPEAVGITSDVPEEVPNPFWAAQEAFYVCHGDRSARAWRELKEWLTGPAVPRSEYHRKLDEYCHRALRRPNIPEELREPISYAWGYHDGFAHVRRRIEAEIEGTQIPTD